MSRRRLSFEKWPAAVYAIGDVHGCLAELLDMERQIAADAAKFGGEKWIVMLGDYVDRGPQSAQVIDHLLQPAPAGFKRFCLVGNHEAMMLDFIEDLTAHSYWLDEGGLETLQSYGARLQASHKDEPHRDWPSIPEDHLKFLRDLPVSLQLPGWLFVHAGIRPGTALAEQTDDDLIWIREPFLSAPLPGAPRVVHGHTPGPEPVVTPYRVCLDTGCFLTGRLAAARISAAGDLSFFTSTEPAAGR